jgi:hypothetical protein
VEPPGQIIQKIDVRISNGVSGVRLSSGSVASQNWRAAFMTVHRLAVRNLLTILTDMLRIRIGIDY